MPWKREKEKKRLEREKKSKDKWSLHILWEWWSIPSKQRSCKAHFILFVWIIGFFSDLKKKKYFSPKTNPNYFDQRYISKIERAIDPPPKKPLKPIIFVVLGTILWFTSARGPCHQPIHLTHDLINSARFIDCKLTIVIVQ